MGKLCKILVCGHSGVGKTSIIEQLLFGNQVVGTPVHPTIEDIYTAVIETDRGIKEKVRIFDLGGLKDIDILLKQLTIDGFKDGSNSELPRHYLNFPDGFILTYDVTNLDSFGKLDKIKKDIDKHRDKREIHIIAIGNKTELSDQRQVDFETAMKWASKEKVRLWECSVTSRKSLVDPFIWLTSRVTQPPSKSTFLPSRKAKQSAANTSSES